MSVDATRVIHSARLLAIVVSCAALTQCVDSLAPVVPVRPELATLAIDPFSIVWGEKGILALGGSLVDSSDELQGNERIPVQLLVASGDSEVVLLESPYFFPGPRSRTLVSVLMRSGHTVDELNVLLASIPGRWWLISSLDRASGAFRVFDSRLVDGVLWKLAKDPRVREAVRDPFAFAGAPPVFAIRLFATLPLDYGEAHRGDGIVQGQKGTTILIKYTQPNGSVISSSMMMQ